MQRLGKNIGGYFGETIRIETVLDDVQVAAKDNGWTSEVFHLSNDLRWLALHRKAEADSATTAANYYISAGIHGDEPAGPLAALELLRRNRWPKNANMWLLPCLNPAGFIANSRENSKRIDLNRDYRHLRAEEVAAHIRWLELQPEFDVTFCLHEDWESGGFYLYELNPDHRPSVANPILEAVAKVCPIDNSPLIEGREANAGLITPTLDPASRPQWPEAFWLIQNKTRQSYTLEAPSDFPLTTRVSGLVEGVGAALLAHQPASGPSQ